MMMMMMTMVSHRWIKAETKCGVLQPASNDDMHRTGCSVRHRSSLATGLIGILLFLCCMPTGQASDDERNLVEEIFDRQNYNPLIRPVQNLSDRIEVRFEMTLIQLIMLDERNQIMKSNIWLRLFWNDYQLQYHPPSYDGIDVIRIHPDRVWKPDIVLFNNADGKFEVSFKANVLIYPDGSILWIPCAIFKSSCDIDVKYFPFDEQKCEMIFGSWTYGADEVNIITFTPGFQKVDLTDYEKSGSWDVYDAVANITEDIDKETGRKVTRAKYTIFMRRKTLFYTVNLIIPSVLVSSLSMIVFYLPATAGERVTMSVSILLALVVYLQVLVTNILPPSSISLPLYAKYLLFTVIIDVSCIANTVIVLNCNFKTPRTHRMPGWIRAMFFNWLPRLLFMKRPSTTFATDSDAGEPLVPGVAATAGRLPTYTPDNTRRAGIVGSTYETVDIHCANCPYGRMASLRHRQAAGEPGSLSRSQQSPNVVPEINKAIEAVRFVGAHLKNEDDFQEVVDDWRFVSLVIDRMLFFAYMFVSVIATCSILIKTPLFDSFNQAEYKEIVRLERLCRDEYTPYVEECNEWYPTLCSEEWSQTYKDPCKTWKNITEQRLIDELLLSR